MPPIAQSPHLANGFSPASTGPAAGESAPFAGPCPRVRVDGERQVPPIESPCGQSGVLAIRGGPCSRKRERRIAPRVFAAPAAPRLMAGFRRLRSRIPGVGQASGKPGGRPSGQPGAGRCLRCAGSRAGLFAPLFRTYTVRLAGLRPGGALPPPVREGSTAPRPVWSPVPSSVRSTPSCNGGGCSPPAKAAGQIIAMPPFTCSVCPVT